MGIFLFSVDLEDVSVELEGENVYTGRVCQMTERYLALLQQYNAKATFFTTGDIAREFPDLIKEIAGEGHEIACHSNKHLSIDDQNPETFKEDLNRNREALQKAGVDSTVGFRAPMFSLTEKNQWVYKVLKDLGFKYSSSVMPMNNPIYGWKSFGLRAKVMKGICELPISVFTISGFRFPLAGGVYFRLLPLFVIRRYFEQIREKEEPIIGYFHPQDGDDSFQKLKYKKYNKRHNFLLNFNKSSLFGKLETLLNHDFRILRYDAYCIEKGLIQP
jgi:polysaccharide deacetylase family protein (PEP-CTERM system associated)